MAVSCFGAVDGFSKILVDSQSFGHIMLACYAPGTIAAAVWAGRRYAEEFDADAGPIAKDMRREVTGLASGPFYWERQSATADDGAP